MLQNDGDLKPICDISSEFFWVFLAELQICLQGDLNMANFGTDIVNFVVFASKLLRIFTV